VPWARRTCVICNKDFAPPHRSTVLSTEDNHLTHCPSCRRLVKVAIEHEPPQSDLPISLGSAPLTQIVFDLETWGLDRGWGVTMVASFMIHGNPKGPERKTLTLREYSPWKKGIRSNDRELAVAIFDILDKGHIAYAHNGDYFDIRWLRTVAMKYKLHMPKLKLIDPAAISRQKYLVGRNSLEAMADFLDLQTEKKKLEKMHVTPEVWRKALLDNDDEAWALLVKRCESDVELLNAVASAVTGDIGLIDEKGSWR